MPDKPVSPKQHTPKGTYMQYANPDYVARRDAVKTLFPRILRIALEARGIRHEDAALTMGLSLTTFRDRLYGRTNMPIEEVVALAQHYNLDLSMLVSPNATIGDLLAVKPTYRHPAAGKAVTKSQRNPLIPRTLASSRSGADRFS